MFSFWKKKRPVIRLELYDVEDIYCLPAEKISTGLPAPREPMKPMKIVPIIRTQAYDAIDPFKMEIK